MKFAISWPATEIKEIAEKIIGKEDEKPEYLLSDNGFILRKAAKVMKNQLHWNVSHAQRCLRTSADITFDASKMTFS